MGMSIALSNADYLRWIAGAAPGIPAPQENPPPLVRIADRVYKCGLKDILVSEETEKVLWIFFQDAEAIPKPLGPHTTGELQRQVDAAHGKGNIRDAGERLRDLLAKYPQLTSPGPIRRPAKPGEGYLIYGCVGEQISRNWQ
jgi:hypothetical protein